jgi:LysM repeat protein
MSMPLPPACPDGRLYTVARGDTLFLLARRFGTTVEALRAANPQITNPNVLVIGQQICLPRGVTPPPPACAGGTIVTVAAGDTMTAIARRFGVGLQAMIAANPQVSDPNLIAVGQRLCVPVPTPAPPPEVPCPGGRIHQIAPGETLFAIAMANGITVDALLRANPLITDPNFLRVGQRICIPPA